VLATDRTTMVVITHNYARFVGTALASAVDQTRRPPVLIMDDDSVDGTEGIVRAFIQRHSGVDYYRSPVARGLLFLIPHDGRPRMQAT
jgi:glycosyltransferase involved in cell wall biosynthesis